MKQANKSHAKFAIILGEKEIKEKRISLKNMETGQQIQIDKSKALEEIRKKLKNC
jgi:histidyl-tRNA synthetase